MPSRVCLTNAQRKTWRGGKGSLKERQLSARCRTRYDFALQFVFGFLPFVIGTWAADWEARDSQVGEFMEAMWAEGEPKSLAGDILSALQWHYS